MFHNLLVCCIGFIIDFILGDPQGFSFHPIRLIGNLIAALDKFLHTNKNEKQRSDECLQGNKDTLANRESPVKELLKGGVLVIVVLVISTGIPIVLLYALAQINRYAEIVVEGILCYFLFATKSLKTESMKVYTALQQDGLEAGRTAVSMIVGRDVDRLDEEGVVKAAIETVAENTSDGIIAPMCYMMLGGAPLGLFYKAVNTMDSMIGYKNAKYLYFGRCAARLDDVVNFIPARFSAICMLTAAYILPVFDGTQARRIYLRDRKKSSSPNAAQTESVCAGAMHIQLLGDAYYFGKLHHKETIGDALRPIQKEQIIEVNRLLYATAIVGMICLALLYVGVEMCLSSTLQIH